MNKKEFTNFRFYFTGIVAIAIWVLLIWNYYHGGVPRHHLLANEELPLISNWWGALLLPLLTWFLLYRIQKKAFGNNHEYSENPKVLLQRLYGFTFFLLFGILLSTFFTFGYPDLCGYMILGLVPLAIFLPIYRAECLLGFVIGMTYTFGAVLPTGVGAVLGLVGLALYLLIRPAILFIFSKISPKL